MDAKTLAILQSDGVSYELDEQGRVAELVAWRHCDEILALVSPFNGLVRFGTPSSGTNDLSSSGLKLLASATNLRELSLFRLDSTAISPDVFAGVFAVPALERLFIDYEGDIDEVLKYISLAQSLKIFNSQRVSDTGCQCLCKLASLEDISIPNSRVTDWGISGIVHLTNLRELNLEGSAITDDGLRNIGQLHELTSLLIRKTRITDRGVLSLHGLNKLRSLSLSETGITDGSLGWIASLPALEGVWLDNTQITDSGIALLHGKPQLDMVSILNTHVTVEGARRLKRSLPSDDGWVSHHDLNPREWDSDAMAFLESATTDCTMDHFGEVQEVTAIRYADLVLKRLQPLEAIRSFVVHGINNGLSRAGIEMLSVAPRLEDVRLYQCDENVLSPDAFALLAKLPKLSSLGIDHRSDLDVIATLISQAKHLTILCLGPRMVYELVEGHLFFYAMGSCGPGDLTDKGLMSIGTIESLGRLDLWNTKISEVGIRYLAGLKELRILSVINTPISDSAVRQIAELGRLSVLSLEGTQITDAGLALIAKMANLNSLFLNRTNVSDIGLRHLERHPSLCHIELQNCQVTPYGGQRLVDSLPTENAVVVYP